MSETVLVALVGGGCTVGGVLLTKVFDWLNERVKAPATMLQQQTAFAQAINTQTAAFIAALQENRAHLEATVTELTAKVEAQQGKIEEQARLILDLQSENERCRGEGRQMAQRVDSLEAHLRRNGVPMPKRAAATGLVELRDGRTTVLMATTDKPRPSRSRRGKTKEQAHERP